MRGRGAATWTAVPNRRLDADNIKRRARPSTGREGEAILYLLTDVVTTEQGTYHGILYIAIIQGSMDLYTVCNVAKKLSSEQNDACQACSPSSIIWYLAKAFMLMRLNVAAGIGSNEQGEYCRAALQRSDCKEPRYKWPTLLYFTSKWFSNRLCESVGVRNYLSCVKTEVGLHSKGVSLTENYNGSSSEDQEKQVKARKICSCRRWR